MGSSAESVGGCRLEQILKCMISGAFSDVEGLKPVGFSHGQFRLVVQATVRAAVKRLWTCGQRKRVANRRRSLSMLGLETSDDWPYAYPENTSNHPQIPPRRQFFRVPGDFVAAQAVDPRMGQHRALDWGFRPGDRG